MVPAAIAKRPIPAGALLTGLLCVVAALWGYPMDTAIWPPVLSVALMVGVFLPLLEAGMQMTREGKTSQSAAIVIFSSALVNPVFGWSLTVLLDNLGLIGDKERGQSLSHLHRWVIPTIVFIVLCAVMLGIGMFRAFRRCSNRSASISEVLAHTKKGAWAPFSSYRYQR